MKKAWFCRIDRAGCLFCGSHQFAISRIIPDQLADTWELSKNARLLFDDREGQHCVNCGMSRRVRMLLWSIRRILPDLANFSVLHINQINRLGAALKNAGSLVETLYDPVREFGLAFNGLVNQDLTKLTFADRQFDLVVHSETLEHVHDFGKALSEIERVLKPGGFQIYTIPLLHDRKTRRRIALSTDGQETPLLPLSFHGSEGEYPVVWEFGKDYFSERKKKIFQVHYDNYWRNRAVFSIIEKKPR
jgi:SAM-dependent methyltransferase